MVLYVLTSATHNQHERTRVALEAVDVDDTILDGRSYTSSKCNSTNELSDDGKRPNLDHGQGAGRDRGCVDSQSALLRYAWAR